MKEFKSLLVTMVLLSMASCVDAGPRNSSPRTTPSGIPKYQEIINSAIGKPVSKLMAEWGPPAKTFRLAGKEYVVYIFDSTVSHPGTSNRYGTGSSGYSYDVTDCTWTFEIRRGIIVGGNAVDGRKGGCARRSK